MTPEEVLSDPCASNWLKQALKSSLSRDPVDNLNDCEFLLQLLQAKHPKTDLMRAKSDYLTCTGCNESLLADTAYWAAGQPYHPGCGITPKQSDLPLSPDAYVAASGAHCPYCNSTDIEPKHDAEFTIDSLFQQCLCLNCRREWTDQYKLVGYSPIN